MADLIMACIESSTLSVLWNGCPLDNFKPFRGIRQGDPLSPYIFVLCLDKLSQLIQKEVVDHSWKPFRINRNGIDISQLSFANDMLLFAESKWGINGEHNGMS